MLIHCSALESVYGFGKVFRMYLAIRGSLAWRAVLGASSNRIGRIMRRVVVTMGAGADALVCAGVGCSAMLAEMQYIDGWCKKREDVTKLR